MLQEEDRTAQDILERFGDLENHPDETIVPYEEFLRAGETYYFTSLLEGSSTARIGGRKK